MLKKSLHILVVFCLISCSQEVELPNQYEENLTVEAFVLKGQKAKVFLTTNLPLTGSEDLDFVRAIEGNAKVEISNGSISEIATFAVDNSRYPNRYYRFDNIVGKEGENYKLKITLKGIDYESQTTIPDAPDILAIAAVSKEGTAEAYNFKIEFRNSQQAQYYKVFVKKFDEDTYAEVDTFLVHNEFFTSDSYAVFVDYIVDNKSKLEKNAQYDLKIVAVTKEEFLFWKSIKGDDTVNLLNIPKFSYEVQSTISNNAFGYFGGGSEVVFRVSIP